MDKIPRILIISALTCIFIAILIKVNTMGKILPGPLPLNWAKIADTLLLFSIALSLLTKNK